jgi:hypothetical protein
MIRLDILKQGWTKFTLGDFLPERIDQQIVEHRIERRQAGEQARQFHLVVVQKLQLPQLLFTLGAQAIVLRGRFCLNGLTGWVAGHCNSVGWQ